MRADTHSFVLALLWAVFLLCACHADAPRQAAEPQSEPVVLAPPAVPDSARLQRQEKIQAELRYYLERHNVQDEGYDMVARYSVEGDSTLATYLPEGPARPLNTIHWRGISREGKGIVSDGYGRIIIGRFQADTLVSGLRLDQEGIYAGMFNRDMEASGHGSYRSVDDSYYEGHWERDRREGFGFCVSPENLRAGWWHEGQFRGERMQYTSERIYGIDISRYQHEQGQRIYPINWRRLRISNLGRRISEQRVSGTVNYPVRFAYIKSTQGITIKNQYYAADRLGCLRVGIRVGAYHFFSSKCGGAEQARYFLANTRRGRGDLPPVLDIEPSDRQIAEMGGVEAMFQHIRQWLNIVENAIGTKPILYVNQRFVNKYLDQAPDLKTGYHFWIARYGEYKPDIHLAIWQLSADGRVAGIRGDVDLNVFNGYEAHWQEFLEEQAIK